MQPSHMCHTSDSESHLDSEQLKLLLDVSYV